MKKVNIKICPICDSTIFEQKFTARDYLVSNDLFEIMECDNCSFRFTNPIPIEEAISKYYQSDEYISHTGKGNSIINLVYKIVQFFTIKSKSGKVEKYSKRKSGKLLDIGCGTGKFLNKMKNSGWNINGVEVDKYAKNLAEVNITQKIFDQQDFFNTNEKYDVITMWHSLEHLHQLKRYLKKIVESLNTSGVVILAVPNYKSYDAKYYKQDWAAYDVPRHLYHFSFDSITKLLRDNGLNLVEHKQLPFDPFYISLISELKVRKQRKLILALWVGLKSYLRGRRNADKGSSVMYIFKMAD